MSPSRRAAILERYAAGAPVKSLGPHSTLYHLARREGTPLRTQVDPSAVLDLWSQGWSTARIAEYLGAPQGEVRQALKVAQGGKR